MQGRASFFPLPTIIPELSIRQLLQFNVQQKTAAIYIRINIASHPVILTTVLGTFLLAENWLLVGLLVFMRS